MQSASDLGGNETVRLITDAPDGLERWRPHQGDEAFTLLERIGLSEESRSRVLDEALAVLARCIPPNGEATNETGLVVGHIQSGKTMSFTTVAALARDNGYPLVIVITGVSKPLFEQSTTRLLDDLQIQTPRARKWKHFRNPSLRGPAKAAIKDTLDEWSDATVPEAERQTVLITVMKNHRHLQNLGQLLRELTLTQAPAIVIDDEADQAGLNALVNEQDESATYRRLLELKAALPHHSFLQYTATPQAPLLINLIDTLSPNFAELLTPGADYVGGRDFFVNRRDLIRRIPSSEIPTRNNSLLAPPESLLFALRLFYLGVAAGIVVDQQRGNRSMLVHPSQETLRHAEYFRWVRDAKTEWQKVLALPETDLDRKAVTEDFRLAYDDLGATVRNLPSFADLSVRLPHALRRTREIEVNSRSGRTPQINWHDTYGHVLVGGQAMDRGFTVEGLTVTYMPRSVGVGNADTVQQRARFLGYKRSYLDYCRVFLESDAVEAYHSYVVHEEDMRGQLERHRERNEPLDQWKRAFLLAPNLSPTRQEVLDLPYMRYNFGNSWYVPRVPHDSAAITEANSLVVDRFLAGLSDLNSDNARTDAQSHLVSHDVSLAAVIEDLLMRYRVTRTTESQRFTALRIQLQQYREKNPSAQCSVYVMSRGKNAQMVRERPLNESGELKTYLLQGPSAGYVGDSNLGDATNVRVQIHHLRLTNESGELLATNVPAIAVWIPSAIREDVLIQPQGGE